MTYATRAMSTTAALMVVRTAAVSVANWFANCWIEVPRSGGGGESRIGSPIADATAGASRRSDGVSPRIADSAI